MWKDKKQKEEKKVLRIAIYIRVSTDDQWKHWYWLDFQLDDLMNLIKYKSTQEPKWINEKKHIYIDEWYSWWDLNRPEYKRMMEDAKAWKFDIVAVWKIDRMSRNLSHLLAVFEKLAEYWVSFYSHKENIDFSWPIWKLTFQIFWALAEFERETIKTRTQEWILASARAWNYVKTLAPYWYEKQKNASWKWSKIIIVENKADVVYKIFHRFVHSGLQYWTIATRLSDEAIPSPSKKSKWNSDTVKDILTRTEYLWYYSRNAWEWEEPIIVSTPAIIDSATWQLANEIVKEIEDKNWWKAQKYLLSSKLIDTKTWRGFVWVPRTWGWFSYRRKWFEKDWIKYPNMEFPMKVLDKFVWDRVEEFINKPKHFFEIYKKQTTELKKVDNLKKELIRINNDIKEQSTIQFNIEQEYFAWKIDEWRKDEHLKASRDKISKFEARKEVIEKEILQILDIETAKYILEDVSKNYIWKLKWINEEQKRQLVNILVEKIEVWFNKKWDIEANVIFRFAHIWNDKNDWEDEPRDGESKIKSADDSTSSKVNGGILGARTQDLRLKRALLYRLS